MEVTSHFPLRFQRSFIFFQIEIALNGKVVDELTQLVHVSKVREMSRHMVTRLKDLIPPQLFLIAIQAKMGNKVMARENIKALRKDVLAKCVSTCTSSWGKRCRANSESINAREPQVCCVLSKLMKFLHFGQVQKKQFGTKVSVGIENQTTTELTY